ncbi:MarR family winged helix-turn-helix transcriptional regulator [Actinopolymorpha alba]|uniref:MarR family winged helix-turn-helix transcriptional regulator n=1 Tax=Actinopolymorpha alba TaxID=533267 RepID=UPI000372AE0F|nr:MarR family transcriptional regulator [Actinopolymorpha alba]
MVNHLRQGDLPGRLPGVPDDELHQTANVLHSASLRLLRRARTVDGTMDLDGPRASLLAVLVFGGPRSVSQLAAIEQVSAPAITKLVNSLEEQGMVERAIATHDRRVVLVSATRAGRKVLERGRAARVRAVADLLEGLPARDLRTIRRSAEKIGQLLARSDDHA